MEKTMEQDTEKQSLDDMWKDAFSEAAPPVVQAPPPPQAAKPAVTPSAPQAKKAEAGTSSPNLDMILDIPVTLTVELGRTKIVVNDLLQLGQGSIIELEKLAGEPMEILINGRLVAMGEAVVVNDKFGVKLTDVVSPAERISRLR